MALATLTIDIDARLANLEKDLGKVAHLVEQSSARMSGAFRSMNSAFQVLTAGAAGGALAMWIKGSIDLQDELTKLSSAYGINAREAAGLKFAAEQNGTSLDLVAKATKELMLNMAATPDKFAKLGVNAKDATGALSQVADIIEQMPEGQQKVALLSELMGKKLGPEMSEFLSQGGASLREYVAKGQDIYKVTKEGAAQAKEFKDQMAELEARTQGVGVALSANLLPGMNDTAKAMNDLATEGHPVLALWRGLAGMGKVAWDLLIPPDNLKEQLSAAGRIKELKAEIKSIEGGLFSMNAEDNKRVAMLKEQIAVIERHAAALDKVGAGQGKPKSAPSAVSDLLNADQKNGLEILRSLERDYQNELAKRKDALNAPLLSASEKQLADDLRAVHKRAQDARVELEKKKDALAGQNKEFKGYEEAVAKVTAEEEKQVAAVQALQAAQDKLNSSWEYGAMVAIRKYQDEAENTAKAVEAVMIKSMNGMADALTQFVMTGKADFRSLADSIISDLIRIQMQKAVAGIMGYLFGDPAAFSASDAASAGMTLAPGYAHGRASGGPVVANSLYRVNENGPELLNYGGNDYLMMGGRGGYVKPLSNGANSGVNVTYAPTIQIDSRTDQAQIQQLVERSVRQGNAELVSTLSRQRAI